MTAVRTYKIAVIAGDGIGQEVIPAGIEVLNIASQQGGFSCQFTEFPWGSEFYLRTGQMMDPDGMQQLQAFGMAAPSTIAFKVLPA